ncbi:MAG: ABC transporter permease [Actinomycetales bacterium]|nr:ABC transporter permease [Actinomycetales bacterium]
MRDGHNQRVLVRPGGLRGSAAADLTALWRRRDLVTSLVMRELRGRYKGSILGVGWSLISPIVTLLIYTLVVGQFLGASRSIPEFGLFLFPGLIVWNFFNEVASRGALCLTENAGLLKKVWFPREVLPLSITVSAVVNAGFQFVALVLGYALLWDWPQASQLAYLIPMLAILLPLSTATALLMAVFNARFRDIQYLLTIGLFVGFFITPILYSWSFVEEVFRGWPGGELLWQAYLLNPMALVVMCAQQGLWPPAGGTGYQNLLYLDSPWATRLWFTAVASWLLLYAMQRLFSRTNAAVVADL